MSFLQISFKSMSARQPLWQYLCTQEKKLWNNKKNTKISSLPSSSHGAEKVFLELAFQTKEVELKKSLSFGNQVKVNNISLWNEKTTHS